MPRDQDCPTCHQRNLIDCKLHLCTECQSPRRRRAQSANYDTTTTGCKRKPRELRSAVLRRHRSTDVGTHQHIHVLPTSHIANCQPSTDKARSEKMYDDFKSAAPQAIPIDLRTAHDYNTATYFDQFNDSDSLHERYMKEVEFLREKLYALKNKKYEIDHNLCDEIRRLTDSKSMDEITIKSPVKSKNKVVVKTRSRTRQLKKVKPKTTITVMSELPNSESESDDEGKSDEELESLSESITAIMNDDDSKTLTPDWDSIQSRWPIRLSLFPYVPPYIRFAPYDSKDLCKIPIGRRFFKWKLSTITPIVVRKTLTNSGFVLVRSEFTRDTNQWMGTWGKHIKSPIFKTLKESQKLNHFPGTFQLGRKDRLWRNFQRFIIRYGHKEFGFLPQTFILPHELKLLKQNWEYKNGEGGELWIIKPPASARGAGIKVINRWSQLPKKTSLIVQKYIANPYLINGSKFDLRLYVLVTSFNPLRIYLYPDGLARFASAKYSDNVRDLQDRFVHLTNYSINKLSSQYSPNEDADACKGHKWTLTKLFEYMQNKGIDTCGLWKNLEQLVIKTMITGESPITNLCEENMNSRYNCYELFGVDVLLDEQLKPWLLEVNISPSLHSASPLDAHVKGPMVHMLLDLAQFHLPTRLVHCGRKAPPCYEPKLYTTHLTKKEREKHLLFESLERRSDYINDILTDLTGDDVRHLTQAEDERVAKGRFARIFPTDGTYKYLHFMENRYYNRLFDAWETKYEKDRNAGLEILRALCEEKVHLKTAHSTAIHKNVPITNMIYADTDTKSMMPNRPIIEIKPILNVDHKQTTING